MRWDTGFYIKLSMFLKNRRDQFQHDELTPTKTLTYKCLTHRPLLLGSQQWLYGRYSLCLKVWCIPNITKKNDPKGKRYFLTKTIFMIKFPAKNTSDSALAIILKFKLVCIEIGLSCNWFKFREKKIATTLG